MLQELIIYLYIYQDDTIKSGQKKFPRSSEKFHSSTIKDDDENFQEPAIKNLKLNAEENHMKDDGVKTPEKASKMLEPNDIRPFGAPPERTGMAQNAVYGTEVEIVAMTTMLQTNILIHTIYKWAYYMPIKKLSNIKKFNVNIYLINHSEHIDRIINFN
ncbi:uncharacterized protein LOC135928432 isoform X3 [Gordionus sp. m RMFG-2023]|uniref:uncharacterized protein LOC135928432 isoform X3 n=1 Tax=Gordionus sp. m RMFG-2023 TaxID=3053472 RepID=UPI0031FCB4BF